MLPDDGRPILAGVHALRQVAHLDVRKSLPAETLRRGINDGLPADIHILSVDTVPHRFHARHAAVARSYLYQIAPPPQRLCQAVRVVGARAARRGADARGRRGVHRQARLSGVQR